jgi:SfnB family sulfur acquisition oxidoreductase
MDQNVPVRHRIACAAEALCAATRFRDLFAAGAGERDRHRALPHDEVAALAASGLWAITVPATHGGIDVAHPVLAEVTALLAEGDPSIAQIPQNHFATMETLRHVAGGRQQADLFAAVLAGARFGNAEAERGPPATTLRRDGDVWRLDGRKAYSTGALFADLITVTARGPDGEAMLAIVARDAPGLSVVDDWSGMGQRTTASGTTVLDGVRVAADRVMSLQPAFGRRGPVGAIAQLLHAAIDLGIARAALREAGRFVRERARPFADSGVARACDDPLLLDRFGHLQVQVHAAEALLHRGAVALDAARAEPGEDAHAAASIAVAEAKTLTTDAALAAASGLFELAGTSSTLAAHNLDRYWRDARTHTLHDPVRWKYHAIGNYALNGEKPPIRSYL